MKFKDRARFIYRNIRTAALDYYDGFLNPLGLFRSIRAAFRNPLA
jgi:hypothetical protein